MSAESKVPEIRFEGFSGEWEEKKLKDVSTYFNGGSFENDVQEKGRYELITLKSVDMSGNIVHSGRYIDIEAPTLSKDTLVMILSEQSPGLLGMTAQIPIDNMYVLNQRVAEIRPNQNISSYFLSMGINRNQQYFSKRGAGTKVQNISKPNVENYKFLCPLLKEQTKIGNYFQQLDTLIAQHQDKHDKLLQIKKSLLKKMFPKQGETKPEIRFKGFSEPWEERALGGFSPNISDGDWIESNHIFKNGKYRIIQTGNLGLGRFINKVSNAKYFHQKDFDEIKANEIFPGDILISRLADPAGRAIVLPETGFRMVTAVDVTIIRPNNKYNSAFLMTLLNTADVLRIVNESVSGTSHKRISRTNLERIKLITPTLKEQAKIGNLFKNLDTLLNQHQSQLNKLKQIKQACLAKMFV